MTEVDLGMKPLYDWNDYIKKAVPAIDALRVFHTYEPIFPRC
jgi:hypothetical protein